MNLSRLVAAMDTRTLLFMSAVVVAAATFMAIFRAFFNRKRSASIYAAGLSLGLTGLLISQAPGSPTLGFASILGDFLTSSFYFCLVWGQRSNKKTVREWPPRFSVYFGMWILIQSALISTVHTFSLRFILNSVFTVVLSVEYLVALGGTRHQTPPFITRVVMAVALSQIAVQIAKILFVATAMGPANSFRSESFILNGSLVIGTFYLVLWAQLVMGIEVAELIEELKQDNLMLRDLSVTDSLTRLFNRFQFNEKAASEIARAARYGKPLSLIMYDLDHFKSVNDTWGHQVGDEVLKQAALIVRSQIRVTDTLFRWGGEEFLILSPDTALPGAVSLAEKARKAIAMARFPKVGHVTASFGVAEWEDNQSAELWLKAVDQALYCAKNRGRDRVECPD